MSGYDKKVYSTMRKPLPVVPSGSDISKDIAKGAMTGASVGMAAGPYGALIGGAAGATRAAVNGYLNQREAKTNLKYAQQSENFLNSLDLRNMNQSESVVAQAKKGMKSKYKSEDIEMEGGEIHVDKNYNIKLNPKNGPTHAEGGIDIKLNPGDAVFNTQNSKEKYSRVMTAIQRYKMNGDSRSKKYLDKLKSNLPDSENVTKAEWGKVNPLTNPDFDVNKDEVLNPKQENIKKIKKTKTPYDILLDKGENFDGIEGKTRAERRAGYAKKYSLSYLEAKKRAGVTGNEWGKGDKDNPNNFGEKVDEWVGYNTLPNDEVSLKNISKTPDDTQINYGTNLPDSEENPKTNEETTTPPVATKEETKEDKKLRTFSERMNNMGKYVSIANNFMAANEKIEPVSRNYFMPEDQKYNDRSGYLRKTAIEGRNTQFGNLRGKGLSAGQQQGYGSQIGARYLDANERINSGEIQRYDSIKANNINARNSAGAYNLGLTNQYDDMDRQSEAKRKAYNDTAFSELSTISQFNEQADYMKKRNAKQDEIDEKTLKLMASSKYRFNPETWGYDYTDGGEPETTPTQSKPSLTPGIRNYKANNSTTGGRDPFTKRYTFQ